MNSIPFPPADYMELVGSRGATESILKESFIISGRNQLNRLIDLNLLNEKTKILDIGCGCGRFARHLINQPIKSYVGFDRHSGMIQWCIDNISSNHNKFTFYHFDLKSPYDMVDNMHGNINVSDFKFPFDDNSFTFINLASVFTHMPFNEIECYLNEMNRVAESGASALFSVFFTSNKPFNSIHNFYFNVEEFFNMIKTTGWVIENEDSIEINYTNSDKEIKKHNFIHVTKR